MYSLALTYKIKHCDQCLEFLDVKFWFVNGKLYTNIKPTDAQRKLNYNSYHPNHIYRGVVYSQALRYRRIINCNERLSARLDELEQSFLNCHYPYLSLFMV